MLQLLVFVLAIAGASAIVRHGASQARHGLIGKHHPTIPGPPSHCILGYLHNVDACHAKPGQVLDYNGTHWRPKTPQVLSPRGGYQHITCARGQIKVCHVAAGGHSSELCLAPGGVDTHLRHPKDRLGPCPDPSVIVTAKTSDECPSACGDTCSEACDNLCPSACDDVCPSACDRIEGPSGPQGSVGLSCWDTNENGHCDLPDEDLDQDGLCTNLDCRGAIGQGERGDLGPPGPHGTHCWDTNEDGACTLPDEDRNGDGKCNALDCKGQCPTDCRRSPGKRGLSCWDLNQNGECDPDEEDQNGDGLCDALDCLGVPGKRGFSCWDLNQNGKCDPDPEDLNGDGVCDTLDCLGGPGAPGPPGTHGNAGIHCWDTNENGGCDMPDEDKNHDGYCDVQDCQVRPDRMCCYVAIAGRHPDSRRKRGFLASKMEPADPEPFVGQVMWTIWTAGGECRAPPSGWLPCDGGSVPAIDHPTLAELVGTFLGDDETDMIQLPKD